MAGDTLEKTSRGVGEGDRQLATLVDRGINDEPANRTPGARVSALCAAQSSGKTPAGWIEERLPKTGVATNGNGVSDAELTAADAALDECLVSLGPLGADNDQIDADLRANTAITTLTVIRRAEVSNVPRYVRPVLLPLQR